MPRPIWKGDISFGLVNIPVALYSAENPVEHLQFHLLDKKNNARIRYEKINEITGKRVANEQIVKAYEFDKGNYVIVEEKELEKTAAQNSQMIEIEDFVDKESVDSLYFVKPYYLVPTKANAKGYLLLRETLSQSKKIGIAKVVIRTKEYLAAILPYKNVLVLNILRYPKEVKDSKALDFPEINAKSSKVSTKEIDMAERLVENMSSKWDPKKYHDENQELLSSWIHKRIKRRKTVFSTAREKTVKSSKVANGKVVDFMSLLKKSIEEKEKRDKTKVKSSSRPHKRRKSK